MKDISEISPYEDIINLPRPESKHHRPMPLRDRAAQFAPFAALGENAGASDDRENEPHDNP